MRNSDPLAAWFSQLDSPFTAEAIFDRLPDVVFFIKDAQARYLVVNSTLVQRCGQADKRDLLGRTSQELFPEALGKHYLAQDQKVLASGAAIYDQLEVHLYPNGQTGWCLTQKLPLQNRSGRVVGLVGISRDLQAPRQQLPEFPLVAKIVDHVQAHLSEAMRVKDLAASVQLSAYQLDQRMLKVFQLTTTQYVQKSRLDDAMRRLVASDEPILEIAWACGYADHSAFTRQFKQTIGVSPAEFRRSQQARNRASLT